MDKSYMLNDYILEKERDFKDKEEATKNLDKLEFRIHGFKTIAELKKEVSIFLEKNDVPGDLAEELEKICSEFNEETDIYYASNHLDDFMKKYLEEKSKKAQDSSNAVVEIKEELVNKAIKDLDNVGITVIGNKENVMDKIQNEDDVYKLKDNVSSTTEYFEERKELVLDSDKPVEINIDTLKQALDQPSNQTVLENTLDQQDEILDSFTSSLVEINEDGTVVVEGNINNTDSMNFALMMIDALVASKTDFASQQKFDMKFIKDIQDVDKFKIIYGDFPIIDRLDPLVVAKIKEIVKSYNANVDYSELLSRNSKELAISFEIISNHVLNKNGAFQMAIKNGGNNHEMIFAMDENYEGVSTAFYQSGAMVTHDIMEHSIIRVNETTQGEKLLVLSSTLENLNQNKLEHNQTEFSNQYQKKLVYPNEINEVANVNKIFLIALGIANILLLGILVYFIFI